MASMITGAYPKTTGMQGKRRFLPTSFNVMSEIFGEAGYDPVPLEKIPSYQIQSQNGIPITDIGFYKAQYDREIRYLDERSREMLRSLGYIK